MFHFSLDSGQIAQQVAALVNNNNNLSMKRTAADIQHSHTDYIVETHGKWVLGAVGLDRQSYTFTEIKHLVVHPEWRGKGLASHLLRRALSLASAKMVYATVREDNEASLRLFESFGFQRAGDYPADGHRVILLVKVSPQWEKIKSDSKSHWLSDANSTRSMARSTLMSLGLGSKINPSG